MSQKRNQVKFVPRWKRVMFVIVFKTFHLVFSLQILSDELSARAPAFEPSLRGDLWLALLRGQKWHQEVG